jgi:hypothetical protein
MNRLRKKPGKHSHSKYPQKNILGINLTKEVKDLYNKTCKTLKKKTEEDPRRWKALPMFMNQQN